MGTDPFIPYGRQWVGPEDVDEVSAAVTDDFLTTGPRVAGFEEALAAALGAGHVVAVNSGTAALHAAYFALGVGRGDVVVTSSLTFAATANAALYLGAEVRFVDVRADTGNMDPEALEAAMDERVRLVAPVDFAGHPADYDAIGAVARKRGVPVVADAAHSIGASYRGRAVGTLADASTFSFHPVKAMTTAEGGAVATDDGEVAQRMAAFRTHGIVREPERMSRDEGPWYQEMQVLGFNYRLSDLQCALGMVQLRRLGRFVARRREIAAMYDEALSDVDGLELPAVQEGVEPAWHLYVVRTRDAGRRRAFFERLREVGLGVQVHYVPVYWHPYYAELGFSEGLCPKAEDYYRRAVSIPMFPRMSDADVRSVVDRIRRVSGEVL